MHTIVSKEAHRAYLEAARQYADAIDAYFASVGTPQRDALSALVDEASANVARAEHLVMPWPSVRVVTIEVEAA